MDSDALAKAIAELIRAAQSSDSGTTSKKSSPSMKAKKTRAPSKYNMEFSKQMKKLKKAHPRTKATKLMGKAHKATKKAMGGRKRGY
tara:strand:+ start:379 stop:639 length:261 start_codon:yes stop_codon:yes gene_type:complete